MYVPDCYDNFGIILLKITGSVSDEREINGFVEISNGNYRIQSRVENNCLNGLVRVLRWAYYKVSKNIFYIYNLGNVQ